MNTNVADVRLVGGRICLDFVNTVDSHLKATPKEYLVDYNALMVWSVRVGLLEQAVAQQLADEAARQPERAAQVLAQARRLRSALYWLFSAAARRDVAAYEHPTVHAAEATLNAMLAEAPARTQIVRNGGQFGWEYHGERLSMPLWELLWQAAALLTSADLALVGECAGEGCSWLFLDTSRKRNRRWCSMEDCGNRAKAKRHYARQRRDDADAGKVMSAQ
jgi:predicted RNA-binding Zn ribbon-like protein